MIISLSLIGLVLDIVGAFYLVVAFFNQGTREITHFSIARYDFDSFVARNKASTIFNGRIGAMFLALGFIFQCIDFFREYDFLLSHIGVFFYFLFPLFAILIIIRYFRERVVAKWVKEAEQKSNKIVWTERQT